jgi:hypothetical protein
MFVLKLFDCLLLYGAVIGLSKTRHYTESATYVNVCDEQ